MGVREGAREELQPGNAYLGLEIAVSDALLMNVLCAQCQGKNRA